MTLGEAAKACNGKLPLSFEINTPISGISTDTREDLAGRLFIPLKGPVFDGHAFIREAYAKGAAAALSEQGGDHVIVVRSTLRALADIASYYRKRFRLPVVAVTGSAGKTTTKDLIASVLSQKYKTLKTQGNLNNEIGLPHMVFRLDDSYTAAVFEMGMNHRGEIHNLSRIAQPDVCVITNIGLAHIENLGSRENILKAKTEIFDYMANDGVCILNADDGMLNNLAAYERKRGRYVFTFGVKNNAADIWAHDVQSFGLLKQTCKIDYNGQSIYVNIPLPGTHMVLNALAAAAAGLTLGLTFEQIKTGIETFKPSKNRMDIIHCRDIDVINDVYNANPDSMAAALSVLTGVQGRTAAVLGDMFELGKFAPRLHYYVGKIAAELGVHTLVCIGKLSGYMYGGFIQHKNDLQEAFYFETKEECGEGINTLLRPGDTVLVKASRGMVLEYIIEILKSRGKPHYAN